MSGRKDFMISYIDDMPSIDSCDAEIDCWETFWFSSFNRDDLPLKQPSSIYNDCDVPEYFRSSYSSRCYPCNYMFL